MSKSFWKAATVFLWLASACSSSPESNATTGGTSSSATGSGTTGGNPLNTCVDGGAVCQPTNPPAGQSGCWINVFPGGSYGQYANACTSAAADNSVPLAPPAGSENLPLFDGGDLPPPLP